MELKKISRSNNLEEMKKLENLVDKAEEEGNIEEAKALVEKMYALHVKDYEQVFSDLRTTEVKIKRIRNILEPTPEKRIEIDDKNMLELSSILEDLQEVNKKQKEIVKGYNEVLNKFIEIYSEYLIDG